MYGGRFGDLWLLLNVGTLLVAALAQQPSLFIIALLLLLTNAVSRLWERWCLERVEYRRTITPARAFAGEEATLRVEVVNRKLLPLAWLDVEDDAPQDVAFLDWDVVASHKPGRVLLRRVLSLRWYERVTHTYRLRTLRRGYFPFGPVTLRSGDIFGLFTTQTTLDAADHLLVYPRVVPVQQLGLPPRFLVGQLRQPRSLMQDPLRILGVREYAPGDSLRQVHWRATARLGDLQVRRLEATTSLDLLLFLNVSTAVPDWFGVLPEALEHTVTVAASLAEHALAQGFRVGLYANTNVPGADQQVRINPGSDASQRLRLLAALAQVNGLSTIGISAFLRRESRSLPWGATIVVVTAVASEELPEVLLRLRRAGRQVAVVQTAGEPITVAAGIPVFCATEVGQEAASAIHLA